MPLELHRAAEVGAELLKLRRAIGFGTALYCSRSIRAARYASHASCAGALLLLTPRPTPVVATLLDFSHVAEVSAALLELLQDSYSSCLNAGPDVALLC